jgi:hypothetical protein
MNFRDFSQIKPYLKQTVSGAWSLNKPLSLMVLVSALFLLICIVNLILDSSQINNEIAWIKPTKFSMSFLIYAATMLWFGQFIKRDSHLFHGASIAALIGATIELVAITLQVVRGTTSHFNTSTPFDHGVFIVVKVAIVPVAAAVLISYILMLRQKNLPAVIDSALHWGLFLTLVGCVPAILMILPDPMQDSITQYQLFDGHTIGHPEGGPGLPWLGWSTVAGDLRASHFLGIHALQALPLAGWFIKTFLLTLSEPRQRALIWNVGYSYLAAIILLMWQALRAESLISPGPITLIVACCVFGLSIVCALTTITLPPRVQADRR